MVGDHVVVVVETMEIVGKSVRVGIRAPRSVPVYRGEIYPAVREENRAGRVLRLGRAPQASRAALLGAGARRPAPGTV